MSWSATRYFKYTDEDGFELPPREGTTREGTTNGIVVYGSCEGTFEYSYTSGRDHMPNGDPGYPPDYSMEMVDFQWSIDNPEVQLDEPKVQLTAEEEKLVKEHLEKLLYDYAEENGWGD